MITINTSCRICRSTSLSKILDLGDQPPANAFLRAKEDAAKEQRFPLQAFLCNDCHLFQLIHVVDKSLLFSDYIYFSSGMPKLSDHFRRYADDVVTRYIKDTSDLIVEIGSNDGILLEYLAKQNRRVLGVDPAKNIAPIAESRNVPTIVDFFSEALAHTIATTHGRAMAIIGNNVVAHINDYHDLGRAIKTLLHPNGIFVFEAPYLIDMFENLAFDTIYHEHLNFLAVRPLKRWAEMYDLEIVNAEITPAQGQSLRVFVGHRGAHPVEPSVSSCIEKEFALGLHTLSSYHELRDRIEAAKEKTSALLHKLKSERKKIAAYGAPAKGNTVLNYYGIGAELIDCALDDLPSKQGTWTPGTHIPVVDRETAFAQKPDCFFLLAWNYKTIIMEKERAFLESGGIFVLPTGETIQQEPKRNERPLPPPPTFQKTPLRPWILVTGGAGFIGSNFIRLLYTTRPDIKIINLDLLTYCGNRNNLLDIEERERLVPEHDRRYLFVHGDICNSDLIQRLLITYPIGAVVNFAAESHVDRSLCSSYDFIRTNIFGVHTLLEAVRVHAVPRFVHISTDEIYGDLENGGSATELAPLNPSNPYSASKASADVLVRSYIRSYDIPALIIRGSNNVGPYQYPEKLVPLAISNLQERQPIPVHGDGRHIRSWLFVEDFCRAIDLVTFEGRPKEIYNASGFEQTNLDILGRVHTAMKIEEPLAQFLRHTNDRPGADRRYAPSSEKIQRELGWKPNVSCDTMIETTVAWYIKNEPWWHALKQEPVFAEHYERQKEARYY